MDCDEHHLVLNEKTQSIQWIEQSIGALVVARSLWFEWNMSTLAILDMACNTRMEYKNSHIVDDSRTKPKSSNLRPRCHK